MVKCTEEDLNKQCRGYRLHCHGDNPVFIKLYLQCRIKIWAYRKYVQAHSFSRGTLRQSRCRIIRQHLAAFTITLTIFFVFFFFSLYLPCAKNQNGIPIMYVPYSTELHFPPLFPSLQIITVVSTCFVWISSHFRYPELFKSFHHLTYIIPSFCSITAWGSVVVKALCYQSDGPGIDSRWCHWIFQ